MNARILFLALALTSAATAPRAQAQLVTYTFGSSASPTTAANSVATNLGASAFSGSLGSPTTGSGTPVYSAGSGGSFFTASAWTGSAPGSNYFEFTLTPTNGYRFDVTSISFGYRATGTGPTAIAIRSTNDGYASNLASSTLTNDGTWHASGAISITLSALSSATTIRVYGSGASASGGTLRLDDVTLNGTVSAVPEPAAIAAFGGMAALLAVIVHRRRQRFATKV
ncbi:MAG: PEP-CTERM sorting domain-containing protein [Opitutae bacterium]|nr:PEP-CTERM sorting domain-containing protein [Opitutae bacterium]